MCVESESAMCQCCKHVLDRTWTLSTGAVLCKLGVQIFHRLQVRDFQRELAVTKVALVHRCILSVGQQKADLTCLTLADYKEMAGSLGLVKSFNRLSSLSN